LSKLKNGKRKKRRFASRRISSEGGGGGPTEQKGEGQKIKTDDVRNFSAKRAKGVASQVKRGGKKKKKRVKLRIYVLSSHEKKSTQEEKGDIGVEFLAAGGWRGREEKGSRVPNTLNI